MTSKQALENITSRINSISLFPKVNRKTYDESWETIERDLELFEKYKELEKELGVDLITYVKLTTSKEPIFITMWSLPKDELVFNKKQKILEIYRDDIIFCKDKFIYKAGQFTDTWLDFKYKDCGKTWALTKEKLE